MMFEKPCDAQSNGFLQHPPPALSATFARPSVNWSLPRWSLYETVAEKSPNSWRIPMLACVEYGTLKSLSISHSSGLPDAFAIASSVGSVCGEIRILPRYLAALRGYSPWRKRREKRWMSDFLRFVDCDVEGDAVVIKSPAAEDRRSFRLVDCVREPDARLERSLERLAIVTRCDIPVEVERHEQVRSISRQRVDSHLRSHVVGVQHVRLIVPANAEIERQLLTGLQSS